MDFVDKNSNSSLKIIRDVVNDIPQVKMITRFMMEKFVRLFLQRNIVSFSRIYKYLRKRDYQNNNIAHHFQRKYYGYFNKLFHFSKFFEIIFDLYRNLIVFFSVVNIYLRDSSLLL